MKKKLKNSLEIAEKKYIDYMSSGVEDFWTALNYKRIREMIKIFSEIILEHFEFDNIKLIETGVSGGHLDYGMFGFFLGNFVDSYGGEMCAVDINCESCEKSNEIFKQELPNLKYKAYCQDSVSFLEKPPIIPNLVHLDSYDFMLFDPFPSALHAWKEFEKIENKMPLGSIIFIDDNWLEKTFLEWFQNGEKYEQVISYPIIGKGTNIYQEVLANRTNFSLIGNHHNPYSKIKVYIKKIK